MNKHGLQFGVIGLIALTLGACAGFGNYEPERFQGEATLSFTEMLSSDEMNGREIGTPGSKAARYAIVARMRKLGLVPVKSSFRQRFEYMPEVAEGEPVPTKPTRGYNVIGLLHGTGKTDHVMIITAHYDHLGATDEGEIYNGADDNASGVAAMLAIAEYFTKNRPVNDILFVALDGEEDGFRGAKHFMKYPRVKRANIAFNLNLDMMARGDNGKLWASGASHNPGLKPIIEGVAARAPVNLRMGYDTGEGREDWTLLSDHAVFFRAGIPHLYLGVEDHGDYHKASDTFANVDQNWFLKSVDTAILMAKEAEANLDMIAEMRRD